MKCTNWIAASLLLAAGPLMAQDPNRAMILGISGGGADHLAYLAPNPTTWFMPGYSLGASLGLQVTRSFSVHSSFIFTRNPTEGAPLFGGQAVNRFYYGASVQYRLRPLKLGIAPYGLAGLGAVSIDQLGQDTFRPTTKPAIMYGGGASYAIPGSRFEGFAELKGFSYRWDMAGFDRTMIDVTFGAGVSYRWGF